ncbi:MAG: hypothetical protein JWO62_1558, partial [Acidimicrobiaceae bacterium]|nr:hypothetical protein [Acidimicrobiaceae bacterium]
RSVLRQVRRAAAPCASRRARGARGAARRELSRAQRVHEPVSCLSREAGSCRSSGVVRNVRRGESWSNDQPFRHARRRARSSVRRSLSPGSADTDRAVHIRRRAVSAVPHRTRAQSTNREARRRVARLASRGAIECPWACVAPTSVSPCARSSAAANRPLRRPRSGQGSRAIG